MTTLKQERLNGVLPKKGNICAVVVTYHPDAQFPKRVAKIIAQVSQIVIVDNHSSEQARQMLRTLTVNGKIELIENQFNLGIATALNQGVKRAIEMGYAWALILDQDSWPWPSMVATLAEIYYSHPNKGEVGIIGSNYMDPSTELPALACEDNVAYYLEVKTVITSGALLSLKLFKVIGPFRDDFFIDQVDHEYCLRLRSYGYKVIISCKPLMAHSIGSQTRHKFLWKRQVYCSNHSPLRRYYITRNRLTLYRIYLFKEPRWVFRSFRAMLKETILIVLFEDQKTQKLKAIFLGIWHALIGRMGKLQNQAWEAN